MFAPPLEQPLGLILTLRRASKQPLRDSKGAVVARTKEVRGDHGMAVAWTKGKAVPVYVNVPMTGLDSERMLRLLGSMYSDYEVCAALVISRPAVLLLPE